MPELTVAIREAALGDVLPDPPCSGTVFLVGRRVAPRIRASVAALIELPAHSDR